MPRGRGGERQGTPGKGYSNRTDLMTNYNNADMSAAGGGVQAPQQSMGPIPEDVPNLFDPTAFPDEPITAGLTQGPGPGPDRDTRQQETQNLRRWLPLLELYLDRPDTPNSVRSLFRYIRGA
jgi:hypothetical protein